MPFILYPRQEELVAELDDVVLDSDDTIEESLPSAYDLTLASSSVAAEIARV